VRRVRARVSSERPKHQKAQTKREVVEKKDDEPTRKQNNNDNDSGKGAVKTYFRGIGCGDRADDRKNKRVKSEGKNASTFERQKKKKIKNHEDKANTKK